MALANEIKIVGEEPYAGNLHVRFREGQADSNHSHYDILTQYKMERGGCRALSTRLIVMVNKIIESDVALKWLEEGNRDYMDSIHNHGDISKEKRIYTHHHGQNPFAVIVACSDSRVIPEAIFMKGIADLFVIRQAGNVLDDFGLGSIEYTIDHLGCKLVLVLGHTKCGAIQSSLEGASDSFIGKIINEMAIFNKKIGQCL